MWYTNLDITLGKGFMYSIGRHYSNEFSLEEQIKNPKTIKTESILPKEDNILLVNIRSYDGIITH